MNTHRSNASSSSRFAGFEWLSLALAALLALPPAAFAAPRGDVSPGSFGAAVGRVLPAQAGFLYTVNTTGDAAGVGLVSRCDTDPLTPGDQCTLRAALRATNGVAGEDTITFNIPATDPGCDSATGKCVINLTQVLPNITEGVAINGPGAERLTVRRSTGSVYRIFTVLATGTVSISGLSITEGNAGSNAGGGIFAGNGIVNIADSFIFGNSAAGGGGIANGVNSTGTINITNSLIFDNFANGTTGFFDSGGGILAVSGTVNIINSVILRNLANTVGGGIRNMSGTMNISNSTITRNETSISSSGVGRGVFGPATVKSTIIVENGVFSSEDVFGNFTSAGFNLIGNKRGSTGFTQPTDQTGDGFAPLNARLADVLIFGALVPAQPLCNSPAFDKGSSAGLTGSPATDVRGAGFPRTIDDLDTPNADGGDGADIGAIERPVCADNQFTFTVNRTGDAEDFNPGDLVCDSDAGAAGAQCTLRAAIQEANAVGDPTQSVDTRAINFAIPLTEPNCDATTGACIINLTRELPQVRVNVSIEGPGADNLTVRRNSGAAYSILTISGPVEVVTISGLTVTNGLTLSGGGGIVFSPDFGTPRILNVTGCKISGNYAGVAGGGIAANSSGATLNVTDSTISNNSTDAIPFGSNPFVGGGGIAFQGGLNTGALTITNSTISDNTSKNHAGGLLGILGKVTITNSQFIGNQADTGINARGGGILGIPSFGSGSSPFSITNSRFIGNRARVGGGVAQWDSPGTTTIIGSTFSGNTSLHNSGGGIYFEYGTLNVTGSTISNSKGGGSFPVGIGIAVETDGTFPRTLNVTNSTFSGHDQGISMLRGTVNVTNSTIIDEVTTGSLGTGNVKSSILSRPSGTFTSGGFNLIGDPGTSTGFTNGVNNDQVGTTASPLDPQLDPAGLQNNGGPTQTIALQPTSPAIDKGAAAGLTGTLTTDQRGMGFARTIDDPAVTDAADGTDIGAFERNPAAPTPTPTPTPTPEIHPAALTLVSESCPPVNGAVDPGERVTLNLTLINNSNTATSDLVGTLHSSPQVIAPSGPQTYGAMAQGGTASRAFSFTADGPPGQVIPLTLQLQDGANNLGRATFNLTLGQDMSCRIPRLIVTSTLARINPTTVQTAYTVQNIGAVSAHNVALTTATLGPTAGTPLPQPLGSLAPGATSAQLTVNFANSTPGASLMLRLSGVYSGGSFSSTRRATVPSACTPGTVGCGWKAGDMVTYNQQSWGSINTTASDLLSNNFEAQYPNGVEIGIPGNGGNSALFTTVDAILDYLPAGGNAGPLENDLLDPMSSPAGVFGGYVLALQFDVDFSDAGHLSGSAPLRFGDLRVCGLTDTPTFNNLTVRQVLAAMNQALGGGSTPYTYEQLAALSENLTESFESGAVSVFAQQHLVNGACPP